MIITEGSETRIERDEWRMWTETSIGVAIFVNLAIYFAVTADRSIEYLPVGVLILVGLAISIICVRRRPVCVIEPARIGYGFLGKKKKMWWIDRDRVRSVLVRRNMLLEVRFYGQDGKLFDSSVFAYFDPKELRQAFESAGIPVR